MILKILSQYASRLEEYLQRIHRRPEGIAAVGMIGDASGETPNKLVISLLNVERETAGGITSAVQHTDGGGYVRSLPPLLVNLNVMMAAVFDERQYEESLSVLSDTLCFIQSAPRFSVNGVDYTIEVVSLSTQDMNNVWTLLGGHYYPSVVCKIRRLTIDGHSIVYGGRTSENTVVEM